MDSKQLLELFTTNELIPKQFANRAAVQSHLALDPFGSGLDAAQYVALLDKRVTEHNLRVLASCYSRIRLSRVAELLDLSSVEVEDELCEVANNNRISIVKGTEAIGQQLSILYSAC